MPKLIIIAGCNGAGKSTFASSFLPKTLDSFDYDKIFLQFYNNLPDSELKERFAVNKATKSFEDAIDASLRKGIDFCHETNFDTLPLVWPKKFKEKGYSIDLIFFCLDNQDIAKYRIQVRTEFKGHFVNDKTIDLKWKAGYKNLNLHYTFFDNVLFVDNSKTKLAYSNILQLEKGKPVLMIDQLPNYFNTRFPSIFKLLEKP